MRRSQIGSLSLLLALFSAGCHFNFDRALSPGEIRGRLLLEDDAAKRKPATDAHVSIVGSAISVPTDQNGRFVMRGLPVGTYQLRVTRDLANTGRQTTILNLQNVQIEGVAGKPGARDLGDVVVAGLGSVHGTLTRNGEQVNGIRVVLKELTEVVATAGVFVLESLPAGTYAVFVVDEQGRTLKGAPGHELKVEVLARKASNLAIELNDLVLAENGTVAGHAYVSNSADPSGIKVKLTNENHDEIIAITNSEGVYTGDGPAGVYTLEATKDGYANSYIEYFVVDGATAAPDMLLMGVDTPGLTCGPDPLDHTATGCGLHASCADGTGSRVCSCVTGFSGNGFDCANVNECDTVGTCDPHAACADTVGSFTCTCNAGYLTTGSTCTDIDECAANTDNCSAHADCFNDPGTFHCTCQTNYMGDGVTCELTEACLPNSCDPHASCSTVNEQPVCTCDAGWRGDGMTCVPEYLSVSAGGVATCAIKTDGSLWCWGANNYGQVGDGSGIDRYYASWIDPSHTWTAVAGGDDHTCAIRADGTLWCWGAQAIALNNAGPARSTNRSASEAGTPHFSPEQIGSDTSWVSLSLGTHLSCGLQTGGVLVCWSDTFGERTEGTGPDFTTITGSHPWTKVSVGEGHACGLQDDNSLWCWGDNTDGQVGDVESSFVLEPFASGGESLWSAVSAGTDHTCAVTTTGTLWCWGANYSDQLGVDHNAGEGFYNSYSPLQLGTATDWSSVASGDSFSCGIKTDKSIWCWGSDYYGELGDGPQDDSFPDPSQVPGTWTAVVAGGSHACGFKTDGSLWCWGDNIGGNLGNGEASTPNGPVTVVRFNGDLCATNNGGCLASTATCSQTPDGTSGAATRACTCRDGYEGNGIDACTIIDLCTESSCDVNATCSPVLNDVSCACNTNFVGSGASGDCTPSSCEVAPQGWCDPHASCSLDEGNDVTCTCGPGYGGNGRTCVLTDPCQINGGGCGAHASCANVNVTAVCTCDAGWSGDGHDCQPNYVQVGTGDATSCAVKKDGTLWCWGTNAQGQVGDGTGIDRLYPSLVTTATDWNQVESGGGFTCAIKTDGTLWCWGGQDNRDGPTQDNGLQSLGGTPQLSPAQVGTDTTWVSLSLGGFGACGIQTSGALICVDLSSSVIQTDGDGGVTSGPQAVVIPGNQPWAKISVGGSHACGVQTDGSLWCWGYNYNGQLGNYEGYFTTVPQRIDSEATWLSVAAGGSHSCAVRDDHTLWCWGNNSSSQLGLPTGGGDGGGVYGSSVPLQVGTDTDWSTASAGDQFSCGLKSSGSLSCWGADYEGQLGDGPHQLATSEPVTIAGSWTQVSSAYAHSCGLKNDGSLWCWGGNSSGELGNGTTEPSAPTSVYRFPTDPCATANGGCAVNGICTQFPPIGDSSSPTVSCECRSGYEGDATTECTLIDLCVASTPESSGTCDSNATCTPEPNNYSCACKDGFGGYPYQEGGCYPVDCGVAATVGWCDVNAACEDVEGVSCICRPGFVGDGRTCTASYLSIEAGSGTTCSIKGDGTLWCWGANNSGSVGDGSGVERDFPSQVTAATDWTSVSTAGGYTCATKSDGTLWCWGGQRMLGREGQQVAGKGILPSSQLTPAQVGTETTWTSVSLGGLGACGIQTGGVLVCVNLSGGSPVQVETSDAGTSSDPSVTVIPGANPWTQVAVGGEHACGIQNDGSLWCWGYNSYGQAGVSSEVYFVSTPTQVDVESTWTNVSAGDNHTCAIKSDRTLWCWGANYNGELGSPSGQSDGGGTSTTSSPLQVGTDSSWTDIEAGGGFTCGLQDLSLYCWGANYDGQIGPNAQGQSTIASPVYVSGLWRTASVGDDYVCAIQSDGTLSCWGGNYDGQQGNGTSYGSPYPRDVYNFENDPCLVNNGGCGANSYCTQYLAGSQEARITSGPAISCDCRDGYEGDASAGCTLIDYCALYQQWGETTCDTYATCTPVVNSYECACNAGFTGSGYGTNSCAPANCTAAAGVNWCDANATCANDEASGSVACTCQDGYIGDGRSCTNGYRAVFAGLDGTTCAFKGDGTLWCWGENSDAQVGDGSEQDRYYPSQVTTDTTWTSVGSGDAFTFATKADGSLWWWGGSDNRESGPSLLNTSPSSSLLPQLTPVRFDEATDWKSVSVGFRVCALKNDGALYCWRPSTGEEPTLVTGSAPWKSVAVGGNHTCAIQTDDTLWCWGYNAYGQTGQSTESYYVAEPAQVDVESSWRAVSTGGAHTCAIKMDGSLWCWGSNYSQECGVDTFGGETNTYSSVPSQVGESSNWSAVSAGSNTTCAMQTDQSLWCWGSNSNGQYGAGYYGSDTYQPIQVPGAWKQFSSGNGYTCAITSGGDLQCWGYGNNGQLGIGGEVGSVPYPVTTYNFESDPCVTDNGGCSAGAYCSHYPEGQSCNCLNGYNTNEDGTCTLIDYCEMYEGPCGSDATCTPVRRSYVCSCPEGYTGNAYDACVPATCAVAAANNWCDVNASCTEGEGQALCACNAGFTGDGRTCVRAYSQVSGGAWDTCAVKSDNTLWCWGSNYYGEVGDGTTLSRVYPSQIDAATDWASVSMGAGRTCAIKTNGTLWCWGMDLQTAGNHLSPVQIGIGEGWKTVSVHRFGACAIDDAGTLFCWPLTGNPWQLPLEGAAVPSEFGWTQVSVGSTHACGRQSDGTIWCWGTNNEGQLGTLPSEGLRMTPVQVGNSSNWASVSTGDNHTCAVDTDGTLWCWGDNSYDECGVEQPPYSVPPTQIGAAGIWTAVAAGGSFTCGLQKDNSLWCWGLNDSGQLGNGSAPPYRAQPQAISGTWSSLEAGEGFVCAIGTNGVLSCWGTGYNGQLGNGDQSDSAYPTQAYNFTDDPCVINNGGCPLVGGECTHTPYNLSCSCLSGYDGDGTTCTLINYCNSRSCDSNATCTPVPNTYTCACNPGLGGDAYSYGGCQPQSCEGAATAGWCDPHAACFDNDGVYCRCDEGWVGDGRTCVPASCATAAAVGWCSPDASCSDDGQAYCFCNNGFTGDGRTCTDIDECRQGYCASEAICTNSPGSYSCACRPGFEGDGYEYCFDATDWAQWPMPDSQTSICSDGIGLAICPRSDDTLGDQDGVVFGRSGLVLNMDLLGQDDPATGLEWSLQINLDTTADKTPDNICGAMDARGGLQWRVPSIVELMSLVDYGADVKKLGWVMSPGFPSAPILTSTSSPVTGERMGLDADTGETRPINVDSTGSVVCVR